MLKFFGICKHDNYHLTTILKTIAIATPSLMLLFFSGVAASNLPLCFALFMVGGLFLYINLMNLIEDLKMNKK